MNRPLLFAILLALVILAPGALASKQYHYEHEVLTGQTALGLVGIFVGGVQLGTLPGDTYGKLDIYQMDSSSDCLTQYHTRDYEETFTGTVSGANTLGPTKLIWNYNSLTFQGGRNQHVNVAGSPTGPLTITFERSQFLGTTALEAIIPLVASFKAPSATIMDQALYNQLETDALSGSTNYQVQDIEADFNGSGPVGFRYFVDNITWTCP